MIQEFVLFPANSLSDTGIVFLQIQIIEPKLPIVLFRTVHIKTVLIQRFDSQAFVTGNNAVYSLRNLTPSETLAALRNPSWVKIVFYPYLHSLSPIKLDRIVSVESSTKIQIISDNSSDKSAEYMREIRYVVTEEYAVIYLFTQENQSNQNNRHRYFPGSYICKGDQ